MLFSKISALIERDSFSYFILFIFILPLSLRISPLFNPLPNRDSGVFIYVAQGLLDGEIPYLDVWDHKPPLIFFLDAVALVFNNSLWGVWFVELLSIVVSSFFCYMILKKYFGSFTGLFSTTIYIVSFFTLGPGNYTEEYSLPLIFLAIYLFISEYNWILKFSSLGLISGLLFTLKPNLIGVSIAVVGLTLLWGYMCDKSIKLKMIVFALFFCVPSAIFGLYFYEFHALSQFIDAVLVYNLSYSSTPILTKLFYSVAIFRSLGFLWLFAAATWIFLVYYALYHRNFWNNTLLSLVLFSFPVECILVAISGRPFAHYGFALLAPCIILFGYMIYNFFEMGRYKLYCLSYPPKYFALVLFILILLYFPFISLYSAVTENSIDESKVDVINYIANNSNSSDYVLIWGAETEINLLSNRKSPSKYVYQWPLYTKGYSSSDHTQKFLQDLIKNKPEIIVDMHSCDTIIPPLNRSERLNWQREKEQDLMSVYGISGRYQLPDSFDTVFKYIDDNYQCVGTIKGTDYPVYFVRNK